MFRNASVGSSMIGMNNYNTGCSNNMFSTGGQLNKTSNQHNTHLSAITNPSTTNTTTNCTTTTTTSTTPPIIGTTTQSSFYSSIGSTNAFADVATNMTMMNTVSSSSNSFNSMLMRHDDDDLCVKQNALTTLLKNQLKQSMMNNRGSNTTAATTTMNDILKMVAMASPLGLQQQDSINSCLGSYAGMVAPPPPPPQTSSYSRDVISEFGDMKSRSQTLEEEMKQITEMSTSQDRSLLKDSVLSVLYQIIDEVLSDTTSSLPLCWSTSCPNHNNNCEHLIKTLSLKWENEQNHTITSTNSTAVGTTNNPMQQNLRQYLSKHTFLTNQELIDLMVNSHNLLLEERSTNNSMTKSCVVENIQSNQPPQSNLIQSSQQLGTTSSNNNNPEEILSLFPSSEAFNAVFKSLGESSNNPQLVFSLLSEDDVHEEISSNLSSPNTPTNNCTTTTATNTVNRHHHHHSSVDTKKSSAAVDSTKKRKSPTTTTSSLLHKSTTTSTSSSDKNQLFGSFLLKTESAKISKTRKSSKSAPAQIMKEKQSIEADSFSRGIMNWNWKEPPKRSKTPNNEPEIVNNII